LWLPLPVIKPLPSAGWRQGNRRSNHKRFDQGEKPMRIADRIERQDANPVIRLSETEKQVCSSDGWKIARFEDGVLMEFFDPKNTPSQNDRQAMNKEAINDALTWMNSTDGEHWLVMCASDQLRNPRRISFDDAGAFAQMAGVFAETLAS
jgi:hypothetical protein